MIASIEGEIKQKTDKYVVVNVRGVGYKIYTTPVNISGAKVGKSVYMYTHLAVRENSMDLYGFKSIEDLNFFELLIGISGIGPKGALGILTVADVETLTTAVSSGDVSYLTKVSGIGKKSAEKIVLELKDKVSDLNQENKQNMLNEEGGALEALKSLGYKHNDARDILKQVSKDAKTAGDMVREALKKLG
ncbi:Holliday junction branch migration protein RuvA [Candidatus Campbellbacteria bacterium CG22_combo_CG10-13_8_21_14_all_36_13]|uniref:Holliday junction branch migration complex subunit RuvA n=1 Tax=Candidatus Campbellbacteria bacterium CG22_combo_CG10-13_8_21_14_all_36_13 TaxID=1974529 RepID=A0A2H0DXQ1_9BACT|nr:MAG: Holliday junction branch migration protein RuvA [Candidatus Campbellbacteria bacterium CG22_combo_CG10-13_8_21_14_all_36_13]